MSVDVAIKLSSLLTQDKWDATYAALDKVDPADFIAQCATVGINDAVIATTFYECLKQFVQDAIVGGWA
jgi:hypothetical protein